MKNIRNFVIIAHIDSGKSTLADRLLEITGTVPMRSMQAQYLDRLPLERERGITIKMTPVRMLYDTQINTDQNTDKHGSYNADKPALLYEDLTCKVRGALFKVYNNLGPSYKENVYQKALELEFAKADLVFEKEKVIDVTYDGKKVGAYRPDFIVGGKVIIEIKAIPYLGKLEKKQTWYYLKGSQYKLALLVNFGGKKLEIDRIIHGYENISDDLCLDPRKSVRVILNLIDTPGHSDFSYEVSRALAAVEGAILLVDGTKGIQAQTLSTLRAAQKIGLKIIPAVNKIDLMLPQIERVVESTAQLLGVPKESIFRISAKTGAGVAELLEAVISQCPPPRIYADSDADKSELNISENPRLDQRKSAMPARALIFDSLYDDHRGIIAFVRVFNGEFKIEDLKFAASEAKFKPKEVGYFSPDLKVAPKIANGEIGYIATGLKEPALVKIGDTVIQSQISNLKSQNNTLALPGYKEVSPVVFISFYPDGATKFDDLKRAFERLRLNDAALSFEPDANEALGRGLKVGFLGQLHFEITSSRLKSEYSLEFLTSFPSIAYRVQDKGVTQIIKMPQDFPDKPEKVWEPIVDLEVLVPQQYLSAVMGLQTVFDVEIVEVENLGDNLLIHSKMPLRELIRDFDDRLKSASQGYASFTYELSGEREAEVEKLEILIVEEVIPALTRIVPKKDLEREGRATVERLKDLLPQEQFSQALQAKALGRIIARETIPAMKKALGDFGKNGGDRTRKMKLWKKQARGKERLQSTARVNLSPEVFREILKK